MQDPNRTQLGAPPLADPNRTMLGAPPAADPNRTIMGQAPSLQATQTIKPVQCPVCKTFNPVGVMFCVECGLIFDRALPDDAFGAPSVQLPVLVDSSGREHPIRPGLTTLGRQGDIAIEDGRVSRRHAAIRNEGGQLSVEDLSSTNGTKLDGNPLAPNQPQPLTNGQKISLGGYELTLSLPGEAGKTQMAMGGKTVGMVAAPTTQTAVAFLIFPDREEPLELGIHPFGRRSENKIVISDPYVSGRHGQFEVTETAVFLTDLGSTNGTVVNEAKLPPNVKTELSTSDVVKLGALELRIRFRN